MAVLERRVFCDCAVGSFRLASVHANQLRRREPVTFIRFVGPVRFCVPALSPERSTTEELQGRPPICARVAGSRRRPSGFYVLTRIHWASTGYQWSYRAVDPVV